MVSIFLYIPSIHLLLLSLIHFQTYKKRITFLSWVLLYFVFFVASAQDTTLITSELSAPLTIGQTEGIIQRRLNTLVISSSVGYTATLTGLHFLWYANSPRNSFHFFDDNAEWKQVDKVGHFYTAYHISRLGVTAFGWTGMPRRKAIWWGGLMGIIFQTPIEILDGFSATYGASWGDLVANTVGSGLLIGQLLLSDEERIHPKFSFHPTSLASLRPNLLGRNLLQQVLKDYNGQTYWFAFDIKPWLRKESRFPAWLCVSIGYGAANMLSANDVSSRLAGFDPYRQYYLSLDVNLTRIPTRSRFLKNVFFLLNTIHIPAPALQWNRIEGFKMHALYF